LQHFSARQTIKPFFSDDDDVDDDADADDDGDADGPTHSALSTLAAAVVAEAAAAAAEAAAAAAAADADAADAAAAAAAAADAALADLALVELQIPRTTDDGAQRRYVDNSNLLLLCTEKKVNVVYKSSLGFIIGPARNLKLHKCVICNNAITYIAPWCTRCADETCGLQYGESKLLAAAGITAGGLYASRDFEVSNVVKCVHYCLRVIYDDILITLFNNAMILCDILKSKLIL